MKLPQHFYLREDVLQISKDLLGKFLVSNIDGVITSGLITETEAYAGHVDRASHAYNGRRTQRTEIMYSKGGTAYVYLCYGIHHLFNVVTNRRNIPHAVLIRAIEPVDGIGTMMARRKKLKFDYTLTTGPGAVSEALAIDVRDTGIRLTGKKIWIEDRGVKLPATEILSSKRVGVSYAMEDALLLYRFFIKKSPWVSKHPK
ncbi:MAG: DNA-3-methyladenine glycosylase [Chitinophagales bacterium]|nr:DNA-3-methyladenine glycosylase [Chitinophagales bacterium]